MLESTYPRMASHLTAGVPSGTTTVHGSWHSAAAQATAWVWRCTQDQTAVYIQELRLTTTLVAISKHGSRPTDLSVVAAAVGDHPRHLLAPLHTALDGVERPACLTYSVIKCI